MNYCANREQNTTHNVKKYIYYKLYLKVEKVNNVKNIGKKNKHLKYK